MGSLQEFIIAISVFINNVLIPLLFGIALLFFLYNTFRFFILGASETEAKENAKRLALYGILGFVFLVSIWGIVNLLVSGLGFQNDQALRPDYFPSGGYYEDSRSWFDVGFMIGFGLTGPQDQGDTTFHGTDASLFETTGAP